MSQATSRRAAVRAAVRAVVRAARFGAVLVAAGVLLSGCVRVHAAFAVSTNDEVSGDLIVAALPSAQAGQASSLTVPPSLVSKVGSRPYQADGYTGTELTFTNLSFGDLSTLARSVSGTSGHYQITFNRSGDLVSVTGSVDLSEVPATGLDVQIKVSFPGTVLRTDGQKSISGSVSTVSWTPKAGRVNTFSATAQYAVGATRTWSFWALMMGLGAFLVAGMVAGLALLARRWQLRKEGADTAYG